MRHPDPRQNQEARVVSDESDVAPARFGAPSYITVAAAQMTRGRTPCHARDGTALCPHQVLQMLAHRLFVSEIVMVFDETVEQGFVGCSSDLLKRDRTDVSESADQRRGVDQNRLRLASLHKRIDRGLTSRGQFDLACPMQH